MCSNDELKKEMELLKKQVASLNRKGDSAIRQLSSEMVRVSSFSHDAMAMSRETLAKMESMEKLLYLWHDEDGRKRDALWKEVGRLNGIKAKVFGMITATAFFVSAFVSGVAWVIHYAWDWIMKAVH